MATLSVKETKDSILKAFVGNYAGLGFRLKEYNEYFVMLYHLDKPIGQFQQSKMTIPLVRNSCQNYLDSMNKA